MAKFTDQFDRYPPNHSLPSIAIPTWPTLVRNEALILLSGFDDAMLVDIGLVLEDMIASAAQPCNFPVAKDAFIWTRIEPHWVSPTFTPKSSNEVRNTFGELNIFLCQCGPPNERELEYKLAFGPKVERWHLLAVLALWKLVDCSDVMLGRVAHNIDGMIPRNKDFRFQNAAGIAMEAQAAVSNALQLEERARHIAVVEKFRDQIELSKRSKKGTDTVVARHKKDDDVRLAAFAMADALGDIPKTEAAERISMDLQWRSGEFVSFTRAYRWLLDRANWEKKIAARSPKIHSTK